MSTSFKRVISHPEELGNLSKKMSMEKHGNEEEVKISEEAPTPTAVVIESDEAPQWSAPPSPDRFRGVSTLSDDNSVELEKEESLVETTHTHPSARTQRAHSGSSGTFGWFIDVHGGESAGAKKETETPKSHSSKKEANDDDENEDYEEPTQFIDISRSADTPAAAMAVTAPNYILEENLSSQMLWKHTAGNRPPQPEEERAYFEMLWRQNFAMSSVDYNVPEEELIEGTSNSPFTDNHFGVNREFSNYSLATDFMATDAEVAEAIERLHGGNAMGSAEGQSTKPKVVNKKVKGACSNEDLTVLIKGDNVFGTTVSKSFDRIGPNGNREVDTVNISVASYRVVESKKFGKYAQYLVIYREGGIRDTIGVWKRYSDFEELSRKVVESQDSCSSVLANMSPLAVTEEGDVEHLPNAITSWRLLKKRQRWFRCLDAGYLSLKVFLLERFLHDILFESSNPNLLRDFVIYDTTGAK